MKKGIIGAVCILVFSIMIFNIKSQEFFVKITTFKKAKTTSESLEASVKPISEKTVRIILKDNNYTSIYHSQINLKSGKLNVYYGKNYKNKKTYKKISIDKESRLFKDSNVIKVEASDTESIVWDRDFGDENKEYQGAFYIYNTTSGLVIVNQVNMNDYAAGVIASEIGEQSPEEALKAQAVCARTYIVDSKPEDYKEFDANGDDSTAYQVYNRISAGTKCKKAVKDTANEIITYKGKPITAYYFSTSCGYTTDYKIWGKEKQKYLKGCTTLKKDNEIDITVEDNFRKFIKSNPKSYESKCPFYRWNVYLSNIQIQNAIAAVSGINVGNISRIEINKRGCGGIASQITVYGSSKQIIMNNQNQIRKALCSYFAQIKLNDGSVRSKMDMLPSAYIYIENVYNKESLCGFKIYGGGYGHGSGMSQNAAREMARKGIDYKKIIKTFYNGVKIEKY